MTAERNLDGGYAIVMRRVYEHPAFRSPQEASVFIWMILQAQWRDTRYRTRWGVVDLKTGELVVAERTLDGMFGLHRNAVRALIQRMVAEGLITAFRDRCPYHAGTIFRVNKYAAYQSVRAPTEMFRNQSKTDVRTNIGPMEDPSGTKNNQGNHPNQEKQD
jgi:hypothetical protein